MKSEQAIANVVKSLGAGVTFVEVGVLRATTLVFIAEECENVTCAIGVDSYAPYVDTLFVRYSVDQALADLNLSIAKQKIQSAKNRERISLVVEDCIDAASSFEDASVDCVFLDAYMNQEQVESHIKAWLPKVKVNGVLCGHDIESLAVQNGVRNVGITYSAPCRDVWLYYKN